MGLTGSFTFSTFHGFVHESENCGKLLSFPHDMESLGKI